MLAGNRARHRRFASGLVCLHSDESGPDSLFDLLSSANAADDFGFAIIYFSKTCCDATDVVSMMSACAGNVPYAACSTAGELTPNGLDEDQILILLFPKQRFQLAAFSLTSVKEGGMDAIVDQVRRHKKTFVDSVEGGTSFGLCLLDGASFMEETVTAAIHWGLDDLPFLGGSAGDNLDFENTALILNGEIVTNEAILILVNTALPVEQFKIDNFIPSNEKLVVTRSQPDQRIVYELNGAPAAIAYANIIGTDPETLTPQSFASHPLIMRVGGEYYCRSIQKVNDDHSLSFFCAIDDGIVLTVAEQTGMARSTSKALSDIESRLGGLDFILGFDCVLRRIDAHNRQVTHSISNIYRNHNVLGFNTYGEQFHSMHLNQTLTGVAFGFSKGGKAQ
ncbi:MAG: FIST C-terminal domain-containing protein [Ahrensia sp.]|nr:FIST C-terminal domain-containing protein [Ahrensia sp.]